MPIMLGLISVGSKLITSALKHNLGPKSDPFVYPLPVYPNLCLRFIGRGWLQPVRIQMVTADAMANGIQWTSFAPMGHLSRALTSQPATGVGSLPLPMRSTVTVNTSEARGLNCTNTKAVALRVSEETITWNLNQPEGKGVGRGPRSEASRVSGGWRVDDSRGRGSQ